MTGRADFLRGVRVLELGDGVAGAAAASLLWSLGADVTSIVDPDSPHRRSRPVGPQGISLLAACLDRGKTVRAGGASEVDAALEEELDLVLFDRVLGTRGGLGHLAALDAYAEFVASHNPGAWVTLSAFGLSGERAADMASELTVAAAAGMFSTVRDPSTGQPLKLAGQQSLLCTGQAAALAACHALDLGAGGSPAHLDLSAVEATMAMGPVLEVGCALLSTGAPGGAARYGAPASFYPCLDGQVRISAMEDHQWQGVVAAMGSPDWTARFASVTERIADPATIDARVAEWTSLRSKRDAESVLQANGVPATAVYSPAEILESPQLAHREAFEPLSVGDQQARVVGLPFRVVAGGTGPRRRRSLRGLRVLEASRVLAVPLAGAVLGALGADVTKLEDLPRLDMYRRRGPYIDGETGPDNSAYFAMMNHSKASAAFDVDADRGRLAALVDSADVVIENWGPKRAGALGLSATAAPGAHPEVLAISSSGFGQDGPHADYRAYAYNLQASCALGYLTRAHDGTGAEIDIAWADLITAYSLATVIAAWAVGPNGNAGVGLDFAMADLVISRFNEHLAAVSLDPETAEDHAERGNDMAPFAPNDVYRAADGWVAITVETPDQSRAMADVLGSNDDIAGTVSSWTASSLATTLRSRGVIAEPILTAGELASEPLLTERGFLVPVEHPVWGARRLVGIPWRPFGAPALALGPPPLFEPALSETG